MNQIQELKNKINSLQQYITELESDNRALNNALDVLVSDDVEDCLHDDLESGVCLDCGEEL